MTGSQSFGPVSTNGTRRTLSLHDRTPVPALLTRMSSGPVVSVMRATESRSHTSARTGRAVPPSCSISAQTPSARSRSRSLTQMSAPARAIWMAMARPTPAPDPVMSAVRPPMKLDQSRIVTVAPARCSDLQNDRDHCGAAAGPFVDEFAEGPAGAEDAVADVAADPVDVLVAGRDGAPLDLDARVVDGDGVAVFADEDVVGFESHVLGERGVVDEVAVLAVDGDEPFGVDEAEDELQLLAGGVTRDVDG